MYQVYYDTPKGTKAYCLEPMTKRKALEMVRQFIRLYVGKAYPNGKGYYPYRNVRIKPV